MRASVENKATQVLRPTPLQPRMVELGLGAVGALPLSSPSAGVLLLH